MHHKASYKKKENWQFIFLAANIDAIETAKNYGISEDYNKRGKKSNKQK